MKTPEKSNIIPFPEQSKPEDGSTNGMRLYPEHPDGDILLISGEVLTHEMVDRFVKRCVAALRAEMNERKRNGEVITYDKVMEAILGDRRIGAKYFDDDGDIISPSGEVITRKRFREIINQSAI